MYFISMVICSTIVNILCAREYVATAKEASSGSSAYDFTFLTDKCAALGDYIPARIESTEQNDAAWAVCQAAGSNICWIDVVRDDYSKSEWYYLADGAYDSSDPITYFNWDSGQPTASEACAAQYGSKRWHDVGCNHAPAASVLCMASSELSDIDYALRTAGSEAEEGSFPLGTSASDAAACAALCDESDVCFSFDYGTDGTCNGNYNRDPVTVASSLSHYSIVKTTTLAPQPILLYEFDDLTETISGGDPKYTLIPGTEASENAPTISDGVLSCDGVDDYLHSQHNLDFYLTDHTLEARVRLVSLGGEQNGAPFSIDAGYDSDEPGAGYAHKGFDAIVYDEPGRAGEITDNNGGKWWPGSEYLTRTRSIVNAAAEDSLDWVHMVITYDTYNDLVTVYRNGVQYGDAFTPNQNSALGSNFLKIDPTETDNGDRPVFCARHTGSNTFAGDVDYAALYDRALSAGEVAVLYDQGPHIPFEVSQCEDDIVYSNTEVIIPSQSPEPLAYIPITNSMTYKFDVVITAWCPTDWCSIFYVGLDGDSNGGSRYPGVWLHNGAGTAGSSTYGTIHISFTHLTSGNPAVNIGPAAGLELNKQYTVEIGITQSTYSISFNGEVVLYNGAYPNHCISGGTCPQLDVPDEGLPLKIGSNRYQALTGVVSNILIRSTCEVCQTICNDEEWIEIATEPVGDAGADNVWRFLDFQDEIYDNYPLCNIKQYKIEYGSSYQDSIVFELQSEHYVFEDSVQSIDFNLPITIVSSTVAGIPVGEAYFCKACATDVTPKYGDTCWGFIPIGDENRGCGCNSGGWTGRGVYYGGYLSGTCNACGCWGGAFSGWKTNGQQKGGIGSLGVRLSILVCNEDITECEPAAGSTLNWDALTTEGTDIPEVDYLIEIDESDLSLHIEVELEYMGLTSADDEGELWGSTYVLDFEDFDAHKDRIYEPGTCQNRVADSFVGRDFADWWLYSEITPERDIGTDAYLAYPPTPDEWTVSMVDDGGELPSCATVRYEGHFTWNQLVGCKSSDGTRRYIDTEEGDKFINLTGVFYVNFVSPFNYGSDSGYYRVYQLLSVPFTIAISKTVNVIGAAGINVMTMSVIAVYKEDGMNTFRLVLLTESSDYLRLDVQSAQGSYVVQLYDGSDYADSTIQSGEFTILDTAVTDGEALSDTPAGCLNNKAFICSQLWEIKAEEVECATKGIDFSGTYTLQFDTECRDVPDISSELRGHCVEWLSEHPDIEDGVALQADLFWRDEVCDPQLFKVQFDAEMYFYQDDGYTTPMDDHLYQVGESTVYVEIISGFPTETYNVFDTVLTDVWLCTFDPLITPDDPHNNKLEGGCFDPDRDGFGDDLSKYYYRIYTDQGADSDQEFALEGTTGHPDSTDDTKDQLRFSFKVPVKIARDKLYVHAQVEVELTPQQDRRRLGLKKKAKKGTKGAKKAGKDVKKTGKKATKGAKKGGKKGGKKVKKKRFGASKKGVNLDGVGPLADQMSHFIGTIGLSRGGGEYKPQTPQEPQQPRNIYGPQIPMNGPAAPVAPVAPVAPNATWTISLNSPWVLAIGGLVAGVLALNVVFMCYLNCCTDQQRARVSFNRRRRSGYSSVKQAADSEYDDSEHNALNADVSN